MGSSRCLLCNRCLGVVLPEQQMAEALSWAAASVIVLCWALCYKAGNSKQGLLPCAVHMAAAEGCTQLTSSPVLPASFAAMGVLSWDFVAAV